VSEKINVIAASSRVSLAESEWLRRDQAGPLPIAETLNAGVPSVSAIAQTSLAETFSRRRFVRRLIVIGVTEIQSLIDNIARTRGVQFEVARLIPLSERGFEEDLARQLSPSVLRRNAIWGVVVACDRDHRPPAALVLAWQLSGIRVFDLSGFCEREGGWLDIDGPDHSWLWSGERFRYHRTATVRKRLLDLLIASIGLALSMPLLLIIAVLIKLDSRGPALYKQLRVGLEGGIFTLYKFRSMRQDAESAGVPEWASIDDPRITRIGRFIRYTRIDELPQLFNVLRGDMSVIGPRPERPYFVDQLASEIPLYSARHCVRPGITGWAQVNASYGASVEDTRIKLRYDLYYIKHCSFTLDFLILLRTIRVIMFQEGAR
jgi:exopolysaccharide biosynthesis polyprenyl glycosylphosphotransferase